MAQRFSFPVLATLAVTALYGSLSVPAAGDDPKPGTIVTVAGTGTPGFSGDNGPATQALLNSPEGLALDGAGNLYIADAHNHRVRRVSPEGTITTVAGTGKPGFSGDGGKATDARLNNPSYMAVDGAGNLFIADGPVVGNIKTFRVRRVDAVTGMITTVAGTGAPGNSGDGGPAIKARLDQPDAVAVDSAGMAFPR